MHIYPLFWSACSTGTLLQQRNHMRNQPGRSSRTFPRAWTSPSRRLSPASRRSLWLSHRISTSPPFFPHSIWVCLLLLLLCFPLVAYSPLHHFTLRLPLTFTLPYPTLTLLNLHSASPYLTFLYLYLTFTSPLLHPLMLFLLLLVDFLHCFYLSAGTPPPFLLCTRLTFSLT